MSENEVMSEFKVEMRYIKQNIDKLSSKADKILTNTGKIVMIESDVSRIEQELKEIKKNMVSEEEFKPYKTSWDIIWKALMAALAWGIVYLLKIGW